eukprot:1216117-Rhodomonas_salina.1
MWRHCSRSVTAAPRTDRPPQNSDWDSDCHFNFKTARPGPARLELGGRCAPHHVTVQAAVPLVT